MTISNYLLLINFVSLLFLLLGNPSGIFIEYSLFQLYVLIFIVSISILFNKKLRNRLLDLLNIHIVIFFVLRIPFLYSGDLMSDILSRNIDFIHINSALNILNLQILIFYTILIAATPIVRRFNHTFLANKNSINISAVLSFTSSIIFLNYCNLFTYFYFNVQFDSSVIKIFFAIFNISVAIIFLISIMFLGDIIKNDKKLIVIDLQLFFCIMFLTLNGSKSGVFQVFEILLVAVILMRGSEYFISARKFLVLCIYFALGCLTFYFGNWMNHLRVELDDSRINQAQHTLLDQVRPAIEAPPFTLFDSISYRLGYLDFFIDKVSQPVYLPAFSFTNYIKAAIDGLTPGFNVWGDIPLVSRAVFNNYFGHSIGPNSEAITIFAEAHLLLGDLSPLIYLGVIVTIFSLWAICIRFSCSNYEKMVCILFAGFSFELYLSGFGLDYWFMANVIYLVVSIYLSFICIKFISYMMGLKSCA